MGVYYRPVVRSDLVRSPEALPLAGGWLWFDLVERLERGAAPQLVPVAELPDQIRTRLSAPRDDIAGLSLDRPRIMGILNVTPDSFSDGGVLDGAQAALESALHMADHGVDMLDIGGESTRPGAETVPDDVEIARVVPAIEAITRELDGPISIDTRKLSVADAAVQAGAVLVNDVSGFTHDKALAPYCARAGLPVCVMHMLGDPQTMQNNPDYDDVLLDIYDALEDRLVMLEGLGIPRGQVLVDPGIGFGKTVEHNLRLIREISLFHALGSPILLGASRKGFIGKLTGVEQAAARVAGSVAVALAGVSQGVQMVRVHDVGETRQALTMWQALRG